VKRFRLIFFVLVLVGAILACRLPGSSTPTETVQVLAPLPPAVEPPALAEPISPPPEVVEPPEAPPPAENQPQPEEPPSEPPVEEPPVEEPPVEEPPQQEPVGDLLPAFPVGFMVGDATGGTLGIFDLQGNPLGVIQVPGLSSADPLHVHFAGSFTGNPQDTPVIYHTYESNGSLKQSLQNGISDLVTGIDVSDLRGAQGQNAMVYTEVVYGTDSLSSYFYFRGASGGGASYFWDRDDPGSWAMQPMAVEAENGDPQGVWYTLVPWGIGGDIVFPPRKGLFHLNINNLEHQLHLTEDFNPLGMSSDLMLVAYTPADNGFIEGANNRLTIYNLSTQVGTYIDLDPSSNRGAGYAVFSPDKFYLAWMEGSGWQMAEVPDFTSRVRIASIAGAISADIPASTFASAAGDPTVTHVVPVCWLDAENLLVEARGDDWYSPALIKVRYDGSGMTKIGQGSFAGFIYP
jgi:hypothetical protein